MKIPAWSFSSLKLFETCPRKYQAEKVTKEVPYEQNESAIYGEQVHKAAENYVKDGTPLPKQFKFIKPYLDKLIAKPGTKYCELKLGIKREDGALVPCDFFDKDVWFRGVADLVIIDGKLGWVADYKTNKNSKYADIRQLLLMAAALFLKFPELEKIRMGLVFVISRDLIKDIVRSKKGMDIFATLAPTLKAMKVAYQTDVWNPKKNGLCQKYCGVMDCPHNGRN